MSLPVVLSAIRELAHQDLDLPENFEKRKQIISQRFSELSLEELEDLAKIEPSKIKVYTNTIFGGQKRVLTNRFPVTFSLLEKCWSRTPSNQQTALKLVKLLHQKNPWQNNSTIGLAENFLLFLNNNLEEEKKLLPELVELAQLEFNSLLIARDKNKTKSDPQSVINYLLSLSVGELLALPLELAKPRVLCSFNYDVVSFRNDFYRNQRKLPDNSCSFESAYYIGSRTNALKVSWNEIPKTVFELFNSCLNQNPHSLSDLAEAYCIGLDNNITPENAFSEFLKFLKILINANAINLQCVISSNLPKNTDLV
jgi:hypothetical protein